MNEPTAARVVAGHAAAQGRSAALQTASAARIDWFRVVVDLERAGWSHEAVAVYLGRSKGWVQCLKDGVFADAKYRDGCRLLALWSMASGRSVENAPTRPY